MKKHIRNIREKKYSLIATTVILPVAALLLFLYMSQMSRTAMDFTDSYMKEMAEHDRLNITEKIYGYREDLLEIAQMIRLERMESLDEAVGLLQLKRRSHNLKSIFLIASDGYTYNYNNIVEDRSDEPCVRAVIDEKKEYLEKPDILDQWYDWNNLLRYAVPLETIRLDGREIVGICGEYPFELIGASLQLKSFDDQGISILLDQKGNILSQTGVVTQKPVDNNFFTRMKENDQVKGEEGTEALIEKIRNMDAVDFRYFLEGKEYLCVSLPIPELQMTLVSSVPVETARLQYHQMLNLTLGAVVLIAVVIFFLAGSLYRSYKNSADLTAQRNAAEELARTKSMFLSNMSHEIRTPLNAIIGFSELLWRSPSVCGGDRDQVEKIVSSSHYLLSLINDILDMSSIENQKLQLVPAPLRLDDLLENIDAMIGGQAGQKGIRYNSANECRGLCIRGDRIRIQQILINLLGNSLKFTPKDGYIRLRVEKVREEKDRLWIRFFVSDTGCGMSKEFLEHLYMPFSQEYNRSTGKRSGTGLGLAITRELVRLMGGVIQVESAPGKGSRFTVEIPFERASDELLEDSGKGLPEQMDWSGTTVLVAEDNELNMEILVSILKLHQIKALQASNGKEACDRFLSSAPDEISAILMDMQMPVMDGLEAADRIRSSEHPRARSIPILAVTANAFLSDVEAAREHGMNGHIAKPINPKQLFEKLYQNLYGNEGNHEV